MAGAERQLILDLPEELWADLTRVTEAFEFANPLEAAIVGLADWIARRKSELDDRDPARRYFVNEALDELLTRGAKRK